VLVRASFGYFLLLDFHGLPIDLVHNMFLLRLCYFVGIVAATSAYSATKKPAFSRRAVNDRPVSKAFAAAAASASLALVLAGSPLAAEATSKTAAQISLNSIPPTAVKVQDVPLIGGTYTMVNDEDAPSPSVIVAFPKDKIGAVKSILGGHLEVDVSGIVDTHVDIDLFSDEAGTLTAKVSNPLIPKLPLKKSSGATGKTSDWASVTNLGDGDMYYFNSKTGETTFEKPSI